MNTFSRLPAAAFILALVTACVFDSSDSNPWKVRASGTDHDLEAVVWAGSQAVAVTYWGEAVTSPDGIHWTVRSTGSNDWLKAVTWTGGALPLVPGAPGIVAVGRRGTILTSPDGITWTRRTASDTVDFTGVAWTGTQLIAVGLEGAVWTSPDGITWTARSAGTTKGFNAIAWAQNQAVAVGGDSLIYTSPDGITWSGHPSGVRGGLDYVAGNASEFLAGQALTGIMTRSPDGSAWTAQESRGVLLTSAPVWVESQWIMGGFSIKGLQIFKSPDGLQWTNASPSHFNHVVNSLAWTGELLIGVGDYGSIITTAPH